MFAPTHAGDYVRWMPRYLLQQWTDETVQYERERGGHGATLDLFPSNAARFEELAPGDVLFTAAVKNGLVLPIARAVVGKVAYTGGSGTDTAITWVGQTLRVSRASAGRLALPVGLMSERQ